MGIPDMARLIELMTPRWPATFDAWESFVTLLIIGIFKLDRGTMMWRRAVTIDRLGWSIIVFDWIFGGLFLLSLFWALYPETRYDPWAPRLTVLALLCVTIWQWVEIRLASQDRVEMVAAGQSNGDSWDGLAERRGFVRRAEDRELRGLD